MDFLTVIYIILTVIFFLFLAYLLSLISKKSENDEYYKFKNEFEVKIYKTFLGWLHKNEFQLFEEWQKDKKKCKKEYLKEKKRNWIFFGCYAGSKKEVVKWFDYWGLENSDNTALMWEKELKRNNKNENWDYWNKPNNTSKYWGK